MGKKEFENVVNESEKNKSIEECEKTLKQKEVQEKITWYQSGLQLSEGIFGAALVKTGIFRFKNRFSSFNESFEKITQTSDDSLKITDTIMDSINKIEQTQNETMEFIDEGE